MSKGAHRVYIGTFVMIIIFAVIIIGYEGYSYYTTSIEERFYHESHQTLKPSGVMGHGFGIAGSLFMLIGVSTYMIRKRVRRFIRWGVLKHWLEFHIFLCTLGPILVLYHTAFKFGGIVSISFYSMVAVVISGVIGRFIYIQIPRTIEGRELSIKEIEELNDKITAEMKTEHNLPDDTFYNISKSEIELVKEKRNIVSQILHQYKLYFFELSTIKNNLRSNNISGDRYKQIIKLVKRKLTINRRISQLRTMQTLFKYWHVAHLPFAIIMLVIMLIHVAVTIVFGYQWIF